MAAKVKDKLPVYLRQRPLSHRCKTSRNVNHMSDIQLCSFIIPPQTRVSYRCSLPLQKSKGQEVRPRQVPMKPSP